jgi:hypothetical protein
MVIDINWENISTALAICFAIGAVAGCIIHLNQRR